MYESKPFTFSLTMHQLNIKIYETKQRERITTMIGAQFTLDFEKVPLNKENAK